jgi:hypothetical protein
MVLLGLFPALNAHAIYKGTSALGSKYVVQVTTPTSWCSGVLVEPQILATAAHCIIKFGVPVSPEKIGIYPPGVDTKQSAIVARGYQIFSPVGYYNNTEFVEPNDIAFVVLDKAVDTNIKLKLANFDLTQSLIAQKIKLTSFGYGNIGLNIRTTVPQQMTARPIGQERLKGFGGLERTYISYAADETGAHCPGDSGGPTIAQYNGDAYLVSIHSGASSPCRPFQSDWGATSVIAGEYLNLLNSALTLLGKLRPGDVSNVKITSNGLIAEVNWDSPKGSPIPTTGFVVTDSATNILCETLVNTCKVSLKPGENLLKIFSMAGKMSSSGVSFSYVIKNATNPEFLDFQTYRDQVEVRWNPISDFGGAVPSRTFVEIRDESDGVVLCSALSTLNGCRFNFSQKGYNLTLNLRSDLGITESSHLGRYSGILQSSLVNRTISIAKNINSQLNFYLKDNPGYKVEIGRLKSQIPLIGGNFVFTEEALTRLLSLRDSTAILVNRVVENPKKSTIVCIKGKLSKKITGIGATCPAGYKLA